MGKGKKITSSNSTTYSFCLTFWFVNFQEVASNKIVTSLHVLLPSCFYVPTYPTHECSLNVCASDLKFILKPYEFQNTFSVARPWGQRSRRPASSTQLCHYKLYHPVQTISHLWFSVSSSVQQSGWTSWYSSLNGEFLQVELVSMVNST